MGPVQRALRWSAFAAAAGAVVYLCFQILRPFLAVLAWSAVLSVTWDPVYQRLRRQTANVTLSALATSALGVFAIVVPLMGIAALAARQLAVLAQPLRDGWYAADGLAGRPAALLHSAARRLGVDGGIVGDWINRHADDVLRGAGQHTLALASSVSGAMLSFVLVVFATFLLLREAPAILDTVVELLPFERRRSETLLHRIAEAVRASIYGVVVVSAIQGALCGVMFALLGIPAAALWGLATVVASVVPVVGTAAVWVPGTLFLILTHHWSKAVILAVWGTLIISNIDNFLRPRLVAGRVGLSELAMFFALLGGLQAFGVLGIVLGPVVFATAAAIVDTLRKDEPDVVISSRDRRPD